MEPNDGRQIYGVVLSRVVFLLFDVSALSDRLRRDEKGGRWRGQATVRKEERSRSVFFFFFLPLSLFSTSIERMLVEIGRL